ncbi:MAG: metallophosphoesterase [Methanomassiliicoccales archaeon]|jgi:putative SbcD/Mre11-related phosphoesterase|nr:metallophosphoesterase [Methanomassiliicoccales archaeon]
MEVYEIMPGVLIANDLCLVHESEGLVAIADLHIGMESALEKEGILIPRMQTTTMKNSLIKIIDKYSPNRILVVGDLKHEFSKNLEQEWNEVRSVLSLLREHSNVTLIKGNHDNYLKTIASKMGIEVLDSFSTSNMTFAHGHIDIDRRPLVMGHEHPSVKILDSVGAVIKLPCFVFLRKEKVIVLPAFSPLAIGVDIARAMPYDCLSPILQKADLPKAEVFACSEVGLLKLGRIEAIRSLSE